MFTEAVNMFTVQGAIMANIIRKFFRNFVEIPCRKRRDISTSLFGTFLAASGEELDLKSD